MERRAQKTHFIARAISTILSVLEGISLTCARMRTKAHQSAQKVYKSKVHVHTKRRSVSSGLATHHNHTRMADVRGTCADWGYIAVEIECEAYVVGEVCDRLCIRVS